MYAVGLVHLPQRDSELSKILARNEFPICMTYAAFSYNSTREDCFQSVPLWTAYRSDKAYFPQRGSLSGLPHGMEICIHAQPLIMSYGLLDCSSRALKPSVDAMSVLVHAPSFKALEFESLIFSPGYFNPHQITHNPSKPCQATHFGPLTGFSAHNEPATDKLGCVPQLASSPSPVSTRPCR